MSEITEPTSEENRETVNPSPDKKVEKPKGAPREISMKIGEKGGLSVYGLGRFPVTLYKEQWLRLLDKADDIRNYIKANEAQLKSKEQ